jgi:hypothetical protein
MSGVMEFSHHYCEHCRRVQPTRFAELLKGELALGMKSECAHCGCLAFTVLDPGRLYCDLCDEVRPGLIQVADAPAGRSIVQCSGCKEVKAVLYEGRVDANH